MSEGERKQTFCDDRFRNISVPPVFLQHSVSARERAGGPGSMHLNNAIMRSASLD